MDYEKFCAAAQALFGPEVKPQDVKTFYRKISNNPDVRTEWCEVYLFACYGMLMCLSHTKNKPPDLFSDILLGAHVGKV